MARRRASARPSDKSDGESVLLENPETGEVRRVPTGFAWSLFLFSGVLGLPLFWRGLYRWGAVFVVLWAIDGLVAWFAAGHDRLAAEAMVFCAFLALQLWLGFRGNALTAKAYLARGWIRPR